MTAQVEKMRKTKKNQTDEDEDINSDCDNMDTGSDDINKYGSLKDILTSDTRVRPKLSFSSDHPDRMTHMQRVLQTRKRFIPVPIGPSIPRRDDDKVKERYCRLMLIMFKPWRHARDLRMANEQWSSAFQSFQQNCSSQKRKIMNNMQILHECKDSRDDHFSQR